MFSGITTNQHPRRPVQYTGSGASITLTGDTTLTGVEGQHLNLDAGGSARNVTLPISKGDYGGFRYQIYNSGGENLVFKDSGGSTIHTLAASGTVTLIDTAPDTWIVVGSSAATSVAASAVSVTDSGGYYSGSDVEAVLAELGADRIYTAAGTITTGQLLALNATPQTMVAAPGAGLFTEVVSVHLWLDYNSAAYDGIAAGEDLAVKYTDASGEEVARVETTGFLDQTSDQHRIVQGPGTKDAVGDFTPVANAAVVLHLLAGEIATGNSPLKYEVLYRVRTLDFAVA